MIHQRSGELKTYLFHPKVGSSHFYILEVLLFILSRTQIDEQDGLLRC